MLTFIIALLTDLPLIGSIVTKILALFTPTAGQKADQPITDAASAVAAANANPGDTSAIENEFSK